jgi:hypothetical protein
MGKLENMQCWICFWQATANEHSGKIELSGRYSFVCWLFEPHPKNLKLGFTSRIIKKSTKALFKFFVFKHFITFSKHLQIILTRLFTFTWQPVGFSCSRLHRRERGRGCFGPQNVRVGTPADTIGRTESRPIISMKSPYIFQYLKNVILCVLNIHFLLNFIRSILERFFFH